MNARNLINLNRIIYLLILDGFCTKPPAFCHMIMNFCKRKEMLQWRIQIGPKVLHSVVDPIFYQETRPFLFGGNSQSSVRSIS